MKVPESINQITSNASERFRSLLEDVRQKDNQDELLASLWKSAWDNTPRLAAMITTTMVSMARFHPLLANPLIGVAAGFVAGTVAGTLAGVGHNLIERTEIDMGELLLAAATDAFATSKNMAIARGVTVGLGRLSTSSYAGNRLVRMATSNMGRGVLVNDAIQVSQSITNKGIDGSVLGWEDLMVSSASGLIGGVWAPYLSRQVFWKEVPVEITREFCENMGQTLLNKEGEKTLYVENVCDQFVLSFTELGSALKGQRGGTYSHADMRGEVLPKNFNPSQHPGVILDGDQAKQILKAGRSLEGANLREVDLHGARLREARLRGANLRGANLRWANLREANLRGANLSEADLRWANLREADLRWANLSEADLRGADLRWANLRGANLIGADLIGADLREAILPDNFNPSEHIGIRLDENQVRSLLKQDVTGFRNVNLIGANLREVDLSGADLYWANLRGADLRGANLRGADLHGADLFGAKLPDDPSKWPDSWEGAILDGNQAKQILKAGRSLEGANLIGVKLPDDSSD